MSIQSLKTFISNTFGGLFLNLLPNCAPSNFISNIPVLITYFSLFFSATLTTAILFILVLSLFNMSNINFCFSVSSFNVSSTNETVPPLRVILYNIYKIL